MRARNIKASFFTNEVLALCSWPARLLFIGLWCVADREGRIEDRPLRIKGQVFPFDDIDVAPLIGELEQHGFVVRYEASGCKCLWIPNFMKHQSPHKNESPSVLPPFSSNGPNDSSNGPKHSPLNEERGKWNPESGMRNEESSVSATADAPSVELRRWLDWWNRLRAGNLVHAGVDAESPSEAVRKAWKRANETREVRDLLADPDRLEKAIRESSFCNAGWFTLPKLFGGKNKTGEWIIQRLLEGGYRDAESRRNGRQSAGKEYDPAAKGDL